MLKAFFTEGDGGPCQWAEPAEDNGRIYSRLLGHELAPAVVKSFSERFSKAAHTAMQQPWELARKCVQAGRFEGGAVGLLPGTGAAATELAAHE